MTDVLAKRECNKNVLRKSIFFIKLAWVTSYNGCITQVIKNEEDKRLKLSRQTAEKKLSCK